MNSLFRPEAVDGQRQAWLGSIRLARPLSLTVLTVFVVGSAAAVMVYLAMAEYTRKARMSGVLVVSTASLNLRSSQAGTVLESHAREGQPVRQGDPLFVLSVDPVKDAADRTSQRRVTISAPQDGVLTAVNAGAGQSVSPAAILASLMPTAAPLIARLHAPASAIGMLRPAQPVLLRYEAFPYQTFGNAPGQVLEVSRTPLAASEGEPPSIAAAPAGAGAGTLRAGPDGGEPQYQVIVTLDRQAVSADGQLLPLAAGMRLQADVLLDRRRLIEWLFEPVLGLAGRV